MSATPAPAFTASNLKGARHGFFGRQGGVSTGIYATLNAGTGSNDDADAVRTNRARIADAMQVAPTHLIGVHQVHSPTAVFVDAPWSNERPQADALVTKTPGLAISILTADCTPVLLIDRAVGIIGAAHAGWKGAISGVLESTVELMRQHGAAEINAAIGPCIHQRSYEVGAEFYERFVNESADYDRFFISGASAKFHLDLPGFCAARLAQAGVSNIEIASLDTYAEEPLLFSHRLSVHRREDGYGRNCAAIAL